MADLKMAIFLSPVFFQLFFFFPSCTKPSHPLCLNEHLDLSAVLRGGHNWKVLYRAGGS